MKLFAVVFAALLAFVAAESEQRINERFVEGIVAEALEEVSNQIRENGLDPFYATASTYQRLPVTDLFVLKAEVEDLLVVGLSNIVLNRISYGILTSRLTFEISLPLISTTIGSSSLDVTLFGYSIDGSVKGSLDIKEITIAGEVRLSIGIISGISVRDVTMDFTLGGVKSDLEVTVLGEDITDKVNELAQDTIPGIISANRNDINRVLEYYIRIILEENL